MGLALDDLSALQFLWGHHYYISRPLLNRWRAVAVKGPRDVLVAATPVELEHELRDHHWCQGRWACRSISFTIREPPGPAPIPRRGAGRRAQ